MSVMKHFALVFPLLLVSCPSHGSGPNDQTDLGSNFYTIPGSTFLPAGNASHFLREVEYLTTGYPTGYEVRFFAPVHLSDVATIRGLEGLIRDNVADSNMILELWVIGPQGGKFLLGTARSSGSSLDPRPFRQRMTTVVDNRNNAYLVTARWKVPDQGVYLSLHKVRIDYDPPPG